MLSFNIHRVLRFCSESSVWRRVQLDPTWFRTGQRRLEEMETPSVHLFKRRPVGQRHFPQRGQRHFRWTQKEGCWIVFFCGAGCWCRVLGPVPVYAADGYVVFAATSGFKAFVRLRSGWRYAFTEDDSCCWSAGPQEWCYALLVVG